MWFVYIVKCADKTLYTGITTDVVRRVEEHNHSAVGAKYTKARRPVRLVYSAVCKNKSLAAQAEYRIKGLTRAGKIKLVNSHKNYGRSRKVEAESQSLSARSSQARPRKRD